MKIEYAEAGNKNNYFWIIKIILKIILFRLPFAYQVWKKIGIFRHGKMDNVDYAFNTFLMHIKNLNLDINDIQGKVVLEIGPGDSVATALIVSSLGAKCILIDANNFISNNLDFYQKLHKKLLNFGLNPPDIKQSKNISEILQICNSHYYIEGLSSLKNIDSESIDLIFSTAVLEHIKLNEFKFTIDELKRVLKPGGLSSHEIDLKDHLNMSLNNLRFSEKLWESNLFSESGFYTNRIRYRKIIKIFESSGFKVETISKKIWKDYPLDIKSINDEFKNESVEQMLISSFNLITK